MNGPIALHRNMNERQDKPHVMWWMQCPPPLPPLPCIFRWWNAIWTVKCKMGLIIGLKHFVKSYKKDKRGSGRVLSLPGGLSSDLMQLILSSSERLVLLLQFSCEHTAAVTGFSQEQGGSSVICYLVVRRYLHIVLKDIHIWFNMDAVARTFVDFDVVLVKCSTTRWRSFPGFQPGSFDSPRDVLLNVELSIVFGVKNKSLFR